MKKVLILTVSLLICPSLFCAASSSAASSCAASSSSASAGGASSSQSFVHATPRTFAHEYPVRAATVFPDGKTLITGTQDGKVHWWHTETGDKFKEESVCGEGERPAALIISSDAGRFAVHAVRENDVLNRQYLYVYNMKEGGAAKKIETQDSMGSIFFHGEKLLYRNFFGVQCVVDLKADPYEPHRLSSKLVSRAGTIGKLSEDEAFSIVDKKIFIWRENESSDLVAEEVKKWWSQKPYNISPNGKYLLTRKTDKKKNRDYLRVWDWQGHKKVGKKLAIVDSESMYYKLFDRNGPKVLVAYRDGTIHILDAHTAKLVQSTELFKGRNGAPRSILSDRALFLYERCHKPQSLSIESLLRPSKPEEPGATVRMLALVQALIDKG